MIELSLTLQAVHPDISSGILWNWFLGTLVMLPPGFGGECHLFAGLRAWVGFFCGRCACVLTLKEIFTGEAGRSGACFQRVNACISALFNTMRFLVTVG